jgi:hypothetical protein
MLVSLHTVVDGDSHVPDRSCSGGFGIYRGGSEGLGTDMHQRLIAGRHLTSEFLDLNIRETCPSDREPCTLAGYTVW